MPRTAAVPVAPEKISPEVLPGRGYGTMEAEVLTRPTIPLLALLADGLGVDWARTVQKRGTDVAFSLLEIQIENNLTKGKAGVLRSLEKNGLTWVSLEKPANADILNGPEGGTPLTPVEAIVFHILNEVMRGLGVKSPEVWANASYPVVLGNVSGEVDSDSGKPTPLGEVYNLVTDAWYNFLMETEGDEGE